MSATAVLPPVQQLPTEKMIETVVHAFYRKVREDELLNPVFGPRLEERWPAHMATMVDFWSSVLLATGRYRGRPLAIHGQLGEITTEMWSRWLTLFSRTARENCPEGVAVMFEERSRQIASHLSRSLAR